MIRFHILPSGSILIFHEKARSDSGNGSRIDRPRLDGRGTTFGAKVLCRKPHSLHRTRQNVICAGVAAVKSVKTVQNPALSAQVLNGLEVPNFLILPFRGGVLGCGATTSQKQSAGCKPERGGGSFISAPAVAAVGLGKVFGANGDHVIPWPAFRSIVSGHPRLEQRSLALRHKRDWNAQLLGIFQ